MTAYATVSTSSEKKFQSVKFVALASLIGTTSEWYDFFIYGTLSAIILNKLFFPTGDPVISTMLAYATFAVGFVVRPVGGIVIGHFGDKVGRKPLLIMTLSAMGVATFLIGLLPTYAQIGIAAPMLLLFLRVCQGVALGGEWGGAVLMAFEYSDKDTRAQYSCYPQIGLAVGLRLASGVIAVLSSLLSDAAFMSSGWRIAFLLPVAPLCIGMFVLLHTLTPPESGCVKTTMTIPTPPALAVMSNSK